jgi:hypothetical protein
MTHANERALQDYICFFLPSFLLSLLTPNYLRASLSQIAFSRRTPAKSRNIQVELCYYTLLDTLPSKIPKVVREKVLTEWLQGLTRDMIAENNDIGKGTVTEIINGYRENNSDIDQQREFVVALMGEGTDLNLFASSIRHKRFIDKLGIDEKTARIFSG